MSVANQSGYEQYPYPVGGLLMFAGIPTSITSNFRLCDGSNLNRADFPELFSIIGTIYGSDDDLTFKLPQTVGNYIRGGDPTANGTITPGSTGGAEIIFPIAEANMPELTSWNGALGIAWDDPIVTIQGNHEYIEYDRPNLDGGNNSGITYTARKQNGPQMQSVNVTFNSINLSHTTAGQDVIIPITAVTPAHYKMQYYIKVRY